MICLLCLGHIRLMRSVGEGLELMRQILGPTGGSEGAGSGGEHVGPAAASGQRALSQHSF